MSAKDPNTLGDSGQTEPSGTLAFKAENYRQYLEDLEMTPEQQDEFLGTLWNIMATFVRLGFGVESVLPTLFQKASEILADGLEEGVIPTHEFNVAADSDTNEKEE